MPDTVSTLTLIVVCGLLSAALALPLRFLFRWPWVWAFVAGIALAAAATIFSGRGIWNLLGKSAVNVIVSVVSVVFLHRKRRWNWLMAVAAGAALFALLCILNLPIETHAVRLDIPPPQ